MSKDDLHVHDCENCALQMNCPLPPAAEWRNANGKSHNEVSMNLLSDAFGSLEALGSLFAIYEEAGTQGEEAGKHRMLYGIAFDDALAREIQTMHDMNQMEQSLAFIMDIVQKITRLPKALVEALVMAEMAQKAAEALQSLTNVQEPKAHQNEDEEVEVPEIFQNFFETIRGLDEDN